MTTKKNELLYETDKYIIKHYNDKVRFTDKINDRFIIMCKNDLVNFSCFATNEICDFIFAIRFNTYVEYDNEI